jgi:hypothetical protein
MQYIRMHSETGNYCLALMLSVDENEVIVDVYTDHSWLIKNIANRQQVVKICHKVRVFGW